MDLISQLPESIVQQILFRLPAQDAVRMSFLSRTWKSLWNSLQVSRFIFFTVDEDGRNRKRKRSAEEFVTSVDESLRVLHEHEDQKRIVRFTLLAGKLHKKKQISDIDRWIKLVIKHYVEVLELKFKCSNKLIPRYSFPPASSDLGSLVILRLHYCDISKEALKQEGMRFSCLKELSLFESDLHGLTNELLSRCPSIETLKFNFCKNLKDLQLCGFSKLKTVGLLFARVYRYKIEASSLQTLRYSDLNDLNDPLDLEAINCINLKELIMQSPLLAITTQYIATLLLKFPVLEKLNLEGTFVSTELKISSHKLKALSLNFDGNTTVKKISIETPNLVSYEHSGGEKFQPSFSLKSTKLENVDLSVSPVSAIGTSWFHVHQLQQYLWKFKPKEGVVFNFHSPSITRYARVELREETIPPVSKIQYFEVVATMTSIDRASFLLKKSWHKGFIQEGNVV